MHSLGGREGISRHDIDFELHFLHKHLEKLLSLIEMRNQLFRCKIEAFRKSLLNHRRDILFEILPRELEAAENEYWAIARQLKQTPVYNAILRSKGSYSNLKYMVTLRRGIVEGRPDHYSTVSFVKPP